jgi:hypothetical protein
MKDSRSKEPQIDKFKYQFWDVNDDTGKDNKQPLCIFTYIFTENLKYRFWSKRN